jgi:hypothetical protein
MPPYLALGVLPGLLKINLNWRFAPVRTNAESLPRNGRTHAHLSYKEPPACAFTHARQRETLSQQRLTLFRFLRRRYLATVAL